MISPVRSHDHEGSPGLKNVLVVINYSLLALMLTPSSLGLTEDKAINSYLYPLDPSLISAEAETQA